MKSSRSELIAVRAVNDYRRRDTFGFLGVRYYVENIAARSDEWARGVAASLVITRSSPAYLDVEHYKERTESGRIEHRSIFVPTPNECIAEAALLAECARHPKAFGNHEHVYSYTLNDQESRSGTFLPYTIGLRRRQAAIATACEAVPGGIVHYCDIRKFYPSVRIALVQAAWERQSREARLPDVFLRLGAEIIDGYGKSSVQAEPALLTGPMFSHLLANLIMREIDCEMCSRKAPAYFRYVDDIVFVGRRCDVNSALGVLKDRIASIGLSLHEDGSPKSIEVSCVAWLEGRQDFTDEQGRVSWRGVIGDLKRYLLLHPEGREELRRALGGEGFRIPVRDYSRVIRERDYARQILRLVGWKWFRRRAQRLSITEIVGKAKRLRDILKGEFEKLCDGAAGLSGYERKRRVSKLRFYIARLLFLSSDEELLRFATWADAIPELFLQVEVMRAVASRRIDGVLALGTNAAQAAAQLLRASGVGVASTGSGLQRAWEHSLAVFLMNGVAVDRSASVCAESEWVRFASRGTDSAMLQSGNAFLREIACLHGISAKPRHTSIFECAFDEDEELSMDAITQLQQSDT